LAGSSVDSDDVVHDRLPLSAAWRRFVAQIVNKERFRDVCTEPGKWFRARENCFVAALATKHSGWKCE
jgi:hypothetical protein